MKKITIPALSRKGIIMFFLVSGMALSILAIPGKPASPPHPIRTTEPALADEPGHTIAPADDLEKIREAESKAAFAEAYRVFMHPRCMNCHPNGDIPLQGDDSHLHTQGVRRGPDGKGLYALKCKNCHQDENLPGEHMPPGLATWHLPPADRPMVFQGKSPRQLAMGFKDAKFTGFASIERIIEHVEKDPLVLHSFTYGTRPPLSHEDFAAKVKEWINKGAALPDK